jgi:hypothetical protein
LPARIREQTVDRCALLVAAVKHGSMVAPGVAGPRHGASGGWLLSEAEERVARGNDQRVPQMGQPSRPV